MVCVLQSFESNLCNADDICEFLITENWFNSLTTEKQTTKFSSANFKKMLSPSYIILRTQRLEGKQCRSR